jgi:hypothetical protein
VAISGEEGYDHWGEELCIAGTERQCVECNRQIDLGEEYEYSWGARLDDNEEVEEFNSFITCVDCTSMRQAFFCESWYVGRTWDDLEEHLAEVVQYGDGVSSECMAQLTKSARDDVCDIVEKLWKEWDDDEEAA